VKKTKKYASDEITRSKKAPEITRLLMNASMIYLSDSGVSTLVEARANGMNPWPPPKYLDYLPVGA
jgi:hypothetical protein